MNINSVQFRHSIIYGSVFGGIIVLILFLSAILCLLPNKSITSLAVPVFIFGAFLCVKHFRDRINEGYITFGKAFGTSLIACITMGVIWGAYRFILFKYISPDMMTREIEEYQEILLNSGWNDKFVEMTSSNLNPFTMGFGYVSNSTIYGSLLSLAIAWILRRNTNPLLIDKDQNI
jgi:hypothetical protein